MKRTMVEDYSALFKALLAYNPDGILLLDAHGRILEANEAAANMLGHNDRAELVGRHPVDFSPVQQPDGTDSRKSAERMLRIAVAQGAHRFEWLHCSAGGTDVHVEVVLTVLTGQNDLVHAHWRDISDRRRMEYRQRRQTAFQKMVVDISARLVNLREEGTDSAIDQVLARTGAFFEADRSYIFRFDETFSTMSNTHEWCKEGVSPHRANLQSIAVDSHAWVTDRVLRGETIHVPDITTLPESLPERAEFERQAIQSLLILPLISDQRVYGFLGYDMVISGREWTDEQISTIKLVAEIIAGTFARLRAERQLKRERDRFDYLSSHDSLTGLANRRQFDGSLEREWKRALRSGEPLGLLMVDIDHFKPYNDYYGHLAGDDVLKAVAREIAGTVGRSTDLAARYGGEEFACILPGTDLQGTRKIAQRIREAVQALRVPNHADPAGGRLTVSIGATALQPRLAELDALGVVHVADKLLYRAKMEGRDRVIAEAPPDHDHPNWANHERRDA